MRLKKEIDRLIEDFIPKIFVRDNNCFTPAELLGDMKHTLKAYLSDYPKMTQIFVYPGGKLGKDIVDLLRDSEMCPCAIIDNMTTYPDYHEVPIISYEKFAQSHLDDDGIVIVAATSMAESFIEQLLLDDYVGEIVDVWKWMQKTYKYLDYPPGLYFEEAFWSYRVVNYYWSIYENEIDELEKRRLFEIVMYGLLRIHDYYSVEEFAAKNNAEGNADKYLRLVNRIKVLLISAADEAPKKDSLAIHIIDSLADSIVDEMDWLYRYAQKGVRLRNVIAPYPTTHYAINTIFTGKDTFEIELQGDVVEWNDSRLLQYIKNECDFYMISTNKHINNEFEGINTFEDRDEMLDAPLSRVLFNGLITMIEGGQKKVVVMHSASEVHEPFFSVGYDCKYPCDIFDREDMLNQRKLALVYADSVLEWYMHLFECTGCTNVIMGDHGISNESTYSFYRGVKYDYAAFNEEEINPAFIVVGEDIDIGECGGFISQTNICEILYELLIEGRLGSVEKFISEYVVLEGIPRYSRVSLEKLLYRKMWGLYEGCVGIRTSDCIYLCYVSGREILYMPHKHMYRNLVNDERYYDKLEECRSKLKDFRYPMGIYRKKKFAEHLRILSANDSESFAMIVSMM